VADKSPVKVCEKSRRVGLSWAEAADDALYASEEGTGEKRNVWYIGYTKDMALEFVNDCANWCRAYNIAASAMEAYEEDDIDINEQGIIVSEKKIQAYKITLNSGWRITALSSRPTNLRGKQGRVVIDEAAFHDDFPGLLKSAMALIMWGGTVRIISTHFGDSNPFNQLVQDIRAGKIKYGLHRVTFDDALADGLYRRICAVLKRAWSEGSQSQWRDEIINFYKDDAEEELFCLPSQGSGVWLSRTQIEAVMTADIPVIRYKQTDEFARLPDPLRSAEVKEWCEETLLPLLRGLDRNRRSYFGEDFARDGDLTVIKPLQEREDTTFRPPFMLELRNVPFREQEQILTYIVDRLPRFSFGALDARGNGQYMAERMMQKYGESRIAMVMITESWSREAMPKYKSAIEDKSVSLPKDADILEDHRSIRVVKGIARVPETRLKGADSKQRHGDSAIASAMAWYATYQEAPGDIDYHSVAKRTPYSDSADDDDHGEREPKFASRGAW
jgi:phage FluMu gp28-like protein